MHNADLVQGEPDTSGAGVWGRSSAPRLRGNRSGPMAWSGAPCSLTAIWTIGHACEAHLSCCWRKAQNLRGPGTLRL